jgi:hypothetical protein
MVDLRTPSPDRLFDLSGSVAVVTGATGVLVNAAGDNLPASTVGEDATFFGLPDEPLREVFVRSDQTTYQRLF